MSYKVPKFGKFLTALNATGIETKTGRGHWGGVNADGEIVVTAWTDRGDGQGRFRITRPATNHGGLLVAWELGAIREGAEVILILIRPRGAAHSGEGAPRQIAGAALMPGKWRVVEVVADEIGRPCAMIEPVPTEEPATAAKAA